MAPGVIHIDETLTKANITLRRNALTAPSAAAGQMESLWQPMSSPAPSAGGEPGKMISTDRPPRSRDGLNPIAKDRDCSFEATRRHIGTILPSFSPDACSDVFTHAGDRSTKSHSAPGSCQVTGFTQFGSCRSLPPVLRPIFFKRAVVLR